MKGLNSGRFKMASLRVVRMLFPASQSQRALFVVRAMSSKKSEPSVAKGHDPVQQLFLDKLKEYNDKSTSGKAPEMAPEQAKELKDELDRISRVYGGGNMKEFPTFKFE